MLHHFCVWLIHNLTFITQTEYWTRFLPGDPLFWIGGVKPTVRRLRSRRSPSRDQLGFPSREATNENPGLL